MLVIVVLVLFCYFGGKYCPSVLKKNKEILLGLAGGLVLCSFFGLRLEGHALIGPPLGHAGPPAPAPSSFHMGHSREQLAYISSCANCDDNPAIQATQSPIVCPYNCRGN